MTLVTLFSSEKRSLLESDFLSTRYYLGQREEEKKMKTKKALENESPQLCGFHT